MLCELENYIKVKYPDIHILAMKTSSLIFEERVKMNCYYCGKYNQNWRCPPKLPDIDYKKMMNEFTNGVWVYFKFALNTQNYNEVRSNSSIILHRALLDMEKYLWDHNMSEAISFIGGSCKLCKNGCGKEKCNNPYLSRCPLEATGVNIIKSVKEYGIDIVFPPKDYMMRLGLLLW